MPAGRIHVGREAIQPPTGQSYRRALPGMITVGRIPVVHEVSNQYDYIYICSAKKLRHPEMAEFWTDFVSGILTRLLERPT